MFALHGSYASGHIGGRFLPHNFSESAFITIRRWLNDCDSSHSSCRRKLLDSEKDDEPLLPTRLVYVGSQEEPDELRLLETQGARGRYMSLSHCWGSHLEVATTMENLSSYCHLLDFSQLSATLQDAIRVTRRLGIQYIWIDSLCIIQNSLEDWNREAGMMGSIYENAYCAIAATDARDGTVGFLDRMMPSSNDDIVGIPCDPDQLAKGFVFLQPAKRSMTTWAMEKSPLNLRAWAMQERILSRRILHFMKGMVYWECDVSFYSADGGEIPRFELPPRVVLLDQKEMILSDEAPVEPEFQHPTSESSRKAFSAAHTSWFDLVNIYSRCGLTCSSDKLPAIMGLARGIQNGTKLVYRHGLWLGHGTTFSTLELFWMPGWEKKSLSWPLAIRAPSWSWASVDGEAQFWDTRPDYWEDKSELEKCYAATIVQIISLPRFGIPDFTSLVIRGKLKLASRTSIHNVDHAKIPLADAESVFIPLDGFPRDFDCNERSYAIHKDARELTHLDSNPKTRTYRGWVCFDCDNDEPLWFYCLPMMVTDRAFNVDGNVGEYEVWRVLAVQRCDTSLHAAEPEYRRVGYGEICGEEFFDGCEYQLFSLI